MNQQQVQVQKKGRTEQKQFWIDFVNGGIAGIISKTLTAPLERVKLLLQTQIDNKSLNKKYNGLVDCLVRCYKEEGFISLWRGNNVNVVRYFPTQALNFSIKEKVSRVIDVQKSRNNKKIFVLKSVLAGGIAGAGTALVMYPLDFARTRMGVDIGRTVNERQFSGMIDCIQKVYNKEGVKGLYAGLNSCLFGIFLYKGLKFGIYDSGKSLILKKDYENSYVVKFLFAQFAVITSETLSYPTDTIKRRLMMQSFQNSPKKYKNSFDCAIKIWQEEGYQGFMKGCFSNMIRGIGSSLCLVLFDEFTKMTAHND